MRGEGNQNHQEGDEYEDEELVAVGSRNDGPSSNISTANSNRTNNNTDGKNSDKASAVRSKHSVTEQRRRSKINDRFQILRELIPQCNQKRDTASFLLEVIEYVRYLQEKVQKYEGSYQGLSTEPTKLMPWRNSHWRVQSFVGHPQAINNGSGLGPVFPRKFDENNIAVTPTMLASAQNTPMEPDPSQDAACNKAMDQHQPDLTNKGFSLPTRRLQTTIPLQQAYSDPQSVECAVTGDSLNQAEELSIEGGTISISSAYSEGLLNALTQALQTAGIDLSQANISVQIDLGKRSNRGLASGTSANKDIQNPVANHQSTIHLRDVTSERDSDHFLKRLKT
ncbi:unnamed protein product [Linum trigynum]|uniref:BHLH domain-containing protein n=1 Tax=Linum trigynum TaxID=586398 RepID=A0AAV2FAJ5_9ROSI